MNLSIYIQPSAVSKDDEKSDAGPSVDNYDGYSLIQSMLMEEATWSEAFAAGDKKIRQSVKGNDSWFRTVFVLRERALDKFIVPWVVCTVNAFLWQVLSYTGVTESFMVWSGVTKDASQSVVLSTALGFLLVFRLNRVAVRWWECRGTWGMIVAYARMLTSAICEHLAHSPTQRDLAVAWIAAFCVACKQFIRGEGHNISPAELAGVLPSRELDRLQQAPHPPLFCCGEIRHAIQTGLRIHHDDAVNSNNIAASVAWSSISRHLETSIDALIVNVGGLERVRASPLPMVYVSHLRTVLLLYLLCLPYIIGPAWGYFTIPTIFLTSFSLLGIDGAAAECESPFRKNRANHLDMEAYCQMAFKNILQIMIEAADRERRERAMDE